MTLVEHRLLFLPLVENGLSVLTFVVEHGLLVLPLVENRLLVLSLASFDNFLIFHQIVVDQFRIDKFLHFD